MKKKIINGLLFAVAMVAATSSFVSCKDYEGDNYAEFQEKYTLLQTAFNEQVAAMQKYVTLDQYGKEVGTNYDLAKGTIQYRLDELEGELDETTEGTLAYKIHKNNEAIATAKGLAERDSIYLRKLLVGWDNAEGTSELGDMISGAASMLKTLKDSIPEYNEAVAIADSAWAFVNKGIVSGRGQKFETLQDMSDAYNAAVDSLQSQIDDLNADVANLVASLKKEVTGIEIQGTMNPIYGTFAWPVGVQSNVLAAYYGETEAVVKFPAGDGSPAEIISWVTGAPAVLSSELKAIKAPVETIEPGILMSDSADNAGKLYLTVNPSNVDFDNSKFELRTSDNKVSAVTLSALESCTDQLKWGYQRRAGSENGFYVAKAKIAKENAKDVAFSFDYKTIGNQFKSIWNNWENASAADIAKLGLTVLNNMKTNVPRLGVQYQWKDTTGWKNYVSKYELAAVSVKPLGFDFLYNQDFSTPIVKLQNKITRKETAVAQDLINQIANAINFEIPYPNEGGTIVDKVYTTTDAAGKKHVYMVVSGVGFSGNSSAQEVTIKAGDFGSYKDPKTGATTLIPAVDQKITIPAVTVSGTTASTNIEITSLFESIANGITNSVSGIKDNASNIINKLLDKLINAENKIFNKVISVAKNPNRYIQPALIAQSESLGYFYPSRIYFTPTQVKAGTVLKFYPTTISAEVVAPAYKKYVAVVNAWDVNDISKTTDASQFNAAPFNTVFNGGDYDAVSPIEFTVPASAKGKVLEIIYECLGYNGKVAGKKYYIEVY